MSRIRKSKPSLPPKEVDVLASLARKGDFKARNTLVMSYSNLLNYLADRYSRFYLKKEMRDVRNIAFEIACMSVPKFDSSKGLDFGAFLSLWLGFLLPREIRKIKRLIYLPVNKSWDYVSDAFVLKPSRMAYLISSCGESTMTFQTKHEDEFNNRILKTSLKNCFSKLTLKQRLVLEKRFGLVDNFPKTLEEIGGILGVSRERVRQIESSALEILRTSSSVKQLEEFYAS